MKRIILNKVVLSAALMFFAVLPAYSASTTPMGLSGFTSTLILGSLAVVQVIAILMLTSSIKALSNLKKFREEAKKLVKTGLVLVATSMAALPAKAQEATASSGAFDLPDTAFWMLVSLNVILLIVIFYLVGIFRGMMNLMKGKVYDEAEEEEEEETDLVSTALHGLTQAVPVEREEEVMLDHEYDGIHELDNKLPPWWVGLFWLSIIFAIVYLIHYHVIDTGDLQIEEYEQQLAEAAILKAKYEEKMAFQIDENNVEMLTAESDLKTGKSIFMANCVACHAESGGSSPNGVGPNLTDKYWIHGGSMSDIYQTVKYGVPSKGMIPWQQQLTVPEMHKVASYVKSLQGTNPPNAKGPQGEEYIPEAEPAGEEAATDSTAVEQESDTLETNQ